MLAYKVKNGALWDKLTQSSRLTFFFLAASIFLDHSAAALAATAWQERKEKLEHNKNLFVQPNFSQ